MWTCFPLTLITFSVGFTYLVSPHAIGKFFTVQWINLYYSRLAVIGSLKQQTRSKEMGLVRNASIMHTLQYNAKRYIFVLDSQKSENVLDCSSVSNCHMLKNMVQVNEGKTA